MNHTMTDISWLSEDVFLIECPLLWPLQVLASDMESQRAIQPFLKYPVLRRLVQQLTNDPNTDFDAWASNPRVIELLQVNAKSPERK